MMRTKGEAGSGNVVEAVRHIRTVMGHIRKLTTLRDDELMTEAKNMGAPFSIVKEISQTGTLGVPNFSAGGIATPADAALVRQLGAEAVFVGSGIFKAEDPPARALAIVHAATYYEDPDEVAKATRGLQGAAMDGIDVRTLPDEERLANRGW